MVVIEEKDSDTNGVIIELEKPDQFDQRERNYYRMSVSWDKVDIIGDSLNRLNNDVLWIYALEKLEDLKFPSEEFKIAQSYVDICISGFYHVVDESFALEFLQKTYGWNRFVLMNRGKKTSAGPIPDTDTLKIIDGLL